MHCVHCLLHFMVLESLILFFSCKKLCLPFMELIIKLRSCTRTEFSAARCVTEQIRESALLAVALVRDTHQGVCFGLATSRSTVRKPPLEKAKQLILPGCLKEEIAMRLHPQQGMYLEETNCTLAKQNLSH